MGFVPHPSYEEAVVSGIKRVLNSDLIMKEYTETEKIIKNCSIIHWQTGKPTEAGYYLTTLKNGKIRSLVWSPTLGYFTNYCLMEKICDVVAWCKLIDIEPYKTE